MGNSRNGNSGSNREAEPTSIHLSLQGKGGVGKSLVASLLAQYFRHRKGIAVRRQRARLAEISASSESNRDIGA